MDGLERGNRRCSRTWQAREQAFDLREQQWRKKWEWLNLGKYVGFSSVTSDDSCASTRKVCEMYIEWSGGSAHRRWGPSCLPALAHMWRAGNPTLLSDDLPPTVEYCEEQALEKQIPWGSTGKGSWTVFLSVERKPSHGVDCLFC